MLKDLEVNAECARVKVGLENKVNLRLASRVAIMARGLAEGIRPEQPVREPEQPREPYSTKSSLGLLRIEQQDPLSARIWQQDVRCRAVGRLAYRADRDIECGRKSCRG